MQWRFWSTLPATKAITTPAGPIITVSFEFSQISGANFTAFSSRVESRRRLTFKIKFAFVWYLSSSRVNLKLFEGPSVPVFLIKAMDTNQLMQTRPLPVARGGASLLSLPPEVLGVLFKQAGKVLDGIATCKELSSKLPNHVPCLRLRPKEASQLLGRDEGFTCSHVVSALQRFRTTPGLEWCLVRRNIFDRPRFEELEETFPHAEWATVTGRNGWTARAAGRMFAFEISSHIRDVLETERAFSTIALGLNSTLGQGVLSTLASLTIGIPCNVNNIVTAVNACSQTLRSFELYGACVLNPPEIVKVGLALQQCENFSSFSLNSINPKGWDISTVPNDAHGVAVVHCTAQLIKSCQLLTEIKLVLCNICDAGAATLATALGESTTIIDLNIDCNDISGSGFRPLFDSDVISHFRSFAGFRPETDGCLDFLTHTLPHATNLQRLEITIFDGIMISQNVEERFLSRCQELGVQVTVNSI